MKLAKLNHNAEIFHTIQGEGKNIGKPSVFIRTSLCNLHCVWCDTDYTWNWEGTPFETTTNEKFSKEEYIINLSPAEIVQEVEKYHCKRVVLTGGEPFMQQEGFVDVMALLKRIDPNYSFEIETNGTLLPSPAFDELIDQYNVSAKLANSNNSMKIRIKPKVLAFFSQSKKSLFKFVIDKKNDLTEVLQLIDEFDIDPTKVYLMPEGKSAAALNRKQKWLVEICKQHEFNYTDRLHVHIYGTKRGV